MNDASATGAGRTAPLASLLAGDSGFAVHADRVTVTGPPSVDIAVAEVNGSIDLSYASEATPASPERVDEVRSALGNARPPIHVDVEHRDGFLHVRLSARISGEGLTRHGLRAVLHEFAHLVETAELQSGSPLEGHDATRVLERTWRATHRVPQGGLPSWPRPDGTGPPAVRLDARVELSVAERRGDWARVVGENGWTGWLDGRRLEPLSAPPKAKPERSQPAPRSTDRAAREATPVLPLLALLLLGSSALLPWLDTPDGERLNALEVPIAFLWDVSAAEPPHLGWAILAIAIAAIALIVWNRATLAYIPLGLAALAIPMFFVAQVFRGTLDAGASVGDAVGAVGIAPLAAAAAAGLLLAAARR